MTDHHDKRFADDQDVMRRALEIARRGIGLVEPNPPVGAVIVDNHRRWIAEGFHQQFGQAHAEVNAIAAAGSRTNSAQLFVTLEPCSHHGKTPPCADAVIAAGFRRVVIGCPDPAPHTAGQGIARLRAAGIEVEVLECQTEAQDLIAPFRKLMQRGLPWVCAKWAMTLDGKIAARTGHSRWVSGEASRAEVHRLRGRMDAIMTGSGTVRADDPMLTARPPGPRTPLRVVFDSLGTSVQPGGSLLSSMAAAPLLVCVTQNAEAAHLQCLQDAGAEVFRTQGDDRLSQVEQVLRELGARQMTNVLLEAGPGLMGSFFDRSLVDEVQIFVAPKIVGGAAAMSPVGGTGHDLMTRAAVLRQVRVDRLADDVLISGRIRTPHTDDENAEFQTK